MRIANLSRGCALVLLMASQSWAGEASGEQRKQLLDVVRPEAQRQAGQSVRIKVDHLNADGDRALLVGSLVTPGGGPLDWRKAKDCDPTLDKMLWATLVRTKGQWRVENVNICASEPPYWYPEESGNLSWPCGVYTGLQGGDGLSMEAQCRKKQQATRP